MKFTNFLRAPILKNICERLPLRSTIITVWVLYELELVLCTLCIFLLILGFCQHEI